MGMPLRVGLFHRRLQPQLDQPQDAAVADPPGHRFHQLVMGDAIERDDNRMPTSTIRLIRIRMRSR
jgi:hypothetical protein